MLVIRDVKKFIRVNMKRAVVGRGDQKNSQGDI